MKIFDFHTHVYPEKIAAKATKSVLDFYGFAKGYHGTAEALIREGEKVGISNYLILPVAIRPEQVSGINDFIANETSAHDEFFGFGTVHAEMQGICEETERIRTLGLRGIKLHPDTQCFNIDDERLFPMYDMIQGKIPVMLHTGDYRYDFSHPRRVLRIMELFPRLTVVAAHFGGWSVMDEAAELLGKSGCYVDVSSSMMFLSRKKTLELISVYGEDRVLFGSDYPLWSPADEFKSFMELELPDKVKEKILFTNAMRLVTKGV